MDLSNPLQLLLLIGFSAIESLGLLALLWIFRPRPPEAEELPGPAGFSARFGLGARWVICFVVLLAFSALLTIPGGAILATIGWWVVALNVFGLTIRQTFKVNIAIGLLGFAIALVVAELVNKPQVSPPQHFQHR